MLLPCANGFGAVALAGLLAEEAAAEAKSRVGEHATAKIEQFPPRARNIIFLYMDGGPSQVDTFDYKPLLARYHGRDPHSVFPVEPTQYNNVGKVMATPWKFQRRGESGLWVSELFPHVAGCADDLTVIHSLVSQFPEHTSAGEFGRTPFAQGSNGRDHNQYGFTIWMTGGGVKSGFHYGETDEWGYKVVKDRVEMHDLHATLLYLLGVDHKRLTFRFGGRDMRLTDVHGEVVRNILA